MNYYRKPINKVIDDVKLKMQLGALTLKISENNNKIDDLIGVDKNIKKDVSSNTSKINSYIAAVDLINTNKEDISDNLELINTNISDISSNLKKINDNKDDISSNLGKINTNKEDISDNLELINTNKSDISSNLEKINDNKDDISSNLAKVNDNKDDIIALQTSNVKAFYNLDKIFIYDFKKSDKFVDKNNYFHVFEKEIIYDFVKNSYLEIILKVLTVLSNYVLIGYFQIVCNFYDQDNNLFYTISLSTATGSINKLSTVKSVFIVPINEHMSKIKIDFFIIPIKGQEHRSAQFIIHDINSNKIYIKYYQKTDEMSIKNIQDSLNTVNNISADLENFNNSLSSINGNILKKVFVYDIEFYKKLIFSYTEKSYLIFSKEIEFNFKANNYIEIYSEILFDYLNDYEIGLLKT